MANKTDVRKLQNGDIERYGNPDGPTFEFLYKKYEEIGYQGDEIYQAIIDKASTTNKEYNALMLINANLLLNWGGYTMTKI